MSKFKYSYTTFQIILSFTGKRCEKKKCTKNEDCEVLNNQGININKDCGFEVCYTGKGHPLDGHCGPALH